MRAFLISIFILVSTGVFAQQPNAQRRPGTGANGQSPFKVTGQVLDAETGEALEYVTTALIAEQDSSVVSGAVTDVEGRFEIIARPGRFTLRINFLSYGSKDIGGIQLNRDQMTKDVGVVRLAPSTEILDEVIVQGEKSTMTMSLDKRVFNVGKDLTNAGRSAADLLDNIPSVQVDVEGNVSLRGSDNVRILVDGKPSGLLGINTADGLRQLQSNMIERVEVVTNPSARYDAEGSAGIINIILKKEKSQGVNGSFTATTGYPQNLGGSFNLNYRKKWTNLFASYGIDYRKSPGISNSFQTFFPGDTLYYTIRESDRERGGWGNNLRFGSDFFLNDKNTITVSALYRISDEDNDYNLNYQDLDRDFNLLFVTDRYDNELEIDKNSEYSINYTRTFSKKGQKLSADVQYRDNNETEESNIEETSFDVLEEMELPDLFQRSLNEEFDRGWLIQADYEHPFGKDGKLEVGFRNSIRRIGNDYLVEEQNEMGEWENLVGFSNNFNYDENIYATYALYGNKANKFSYQLGLRAEVTDIQTELEETAEVNSKNYTDLFPSAHLTYTLKEEKFLQASYSRRIRRPRFRSLNPFSSFSDARNIRSGNPDLNPTYSDSYELGVLQNWEQSSFYYALYYRYSTGEVNYITTVDDEGTTYTRPENVGTSDALGLEVNYSNEFNSWWRVNANANLYHAASDAFADGEDLSTKTTTFYTRLMSQMKIKKDWNFQTSLSYRAPQEVPQGRRKSYFVVDMGFNRDIMKGNGTLTLSVRDLFNTRKYRYETITSTYTSDAVYQRRARSVVISFNYRLNQRKQRERGGRGGDGDFDGGGDMDF
ncbi:MAG: TonB-dependent receptor [Cyclobacteriaceae bacterium]|nr:MAG: TonB-dependent receptor [Cyclobacteriaceae bacterium]